MIIELSNFFNNPSIIKIGSFSIQYYAVTWALSALFILIFLQRSRIISELHINKEKVSDMVIFYGLFLGAICGGRIGYMFVYGLDQLLANPLSMFFVWQGGLSFHGGLLGVVISLFYFAKKNHISFLRLLDAVAVAMPIGLGLVRIGNFLNGELYGRPTNEEWGFVFPTDPYGLLRHPSQLYESFGEGVILFLILYFISIYSKTIGVISSSFLIFYGIIRFSIEYFRQPDSHLGYVAFDALSMGQILCIPMIIIGIIMFIFSRKKT